MISNWTIHIHYSFCQFFRKSFVSFSPFFVLLFFSWEVSYGSTESEDFPGRKYLGELKPATSWNDRIIPKAGSLRVAGIFRQIHRETL